MTKLNEVYRCNVCGNIVEVLHAGAGELVCCGQPMELKTENTVDASKEKHVPVIEQVDDKLIVKVGSELHPMEPEHYIEWIEINMKDKNKVIRIDLKPGDKPEVKFCACSEDFEVRAYCNLHGLWQA